MKTFKEFIQLQEKTQIIKGVKPKDFKKWIRSESEVIKALKDNLNTSDMTIENVAKLYALYNICVADNVTLKFSIDDIWKYREWDRNVFKPMGKSGKILWNGINTKDYYDELKQDIQKNGIKEKLYISFYRDNGNVEVTLGEGNHRIAIAKELKIKQKLSASIGYAG